MDGNLNTQNQNENHHQRQLSHPQLQLQPQILHMQQHQQQHQHQQLQQLQQFQHQNQHQHQHQQHPHRPQHQHLQQQQQQHPSATLTSISAGSPTHSSISSIPVTTTSTQDYYRDHPPLPPVRWSPPSPQTNTVSSFQQSQFADNFQEGSSPSSAKRKRYDSLSPLTKELSSHAKKPRRPTITKTDAEEFYHIKERASSINSNSSSGRAGTSTIACEKPRLTEQEKKNNHIASEQKRRMAIREGFDRLTEIVPGLEGQGRSESIVLRKSVEHMRMVLSERQELIERIQALGGEIPPEFRLSVFQLLPHDELEGGVGAQQQYFSSSTSV